MGGEEHVGTRSGPTPTARGLILIDPRWEGGREGEGGGETTVYGHILVSKGTIASAVFMVTC